MQGKEDRMRKKGIKESLLPSKANYFLVFLYLGVDPTDDLIHALQASFGMQFGRLDHGLPDGGGMLLQFGNHGRIVEDAAGYLTMPTAQPQYQMQRRFLLDVIIREGPSILQLLPGKDQTLLIRWNTFLNY